MKKGLMIFGMAMALLLGTVIALAAPTAGTIWGTVSNTGGTLTTLADLLVASDGQTAPGLAVALRVHIAKANGAIQQLSALDVTAMSDEEVSAYAEGVTSLNKALRYASQVAAGLGYSDLAARADAATNALVGVVLAQAGLDGRLYNSIFPPGPLAPTGGSIWGTVMKTGGGGGAP